MRTQIYTMSLGRRSFLWLLGLSLLVVSSIGHAMVVSGSSSSYGESVNVILTVPLVGNVVLNSGPQPISSGSAPSPYNVSNDAVSASIAALGLFNLGTELLLANAASDINGTAGDKTASADATVDRLGLSTLAGLFRLSADQIQSSATITGDFNSFNAIGSTTLVDAVLSTLLISSGLSTSPSANTVVDIQGLLGLTGISLILNEQILTGDGVASRGLAVNAIHIGFTNFVSGVNVLNGDIIIAHSEARILAQNDPAHVPEPGTFALQALGLMVMLFVAARRSTYWLA